MNLDELAQALFMGGGNTGQPQGGAIGGLMENPAFNMGVGLMQAGAPNPTHPTNFGTALGRANTYAGERQQQSIMNDVRRQALSQAQQEQAGLAAFMKWKQENPDAPQDQVLNKAYETMPQASVQALVSNLTNPLYAVQAEAAGLGNDQKRLDLQEKGQQIALERRGAFTDYQQLYGLNQSLNYLQDKPYAQRLLNNPDLAAAAASGISDDDLVGQVLSAGGEMISGLPKAEQKKVLNAVAYALKAQANVALGSSNAVGAQARAEKGLGQGFPIATQKKIAEQLLGQAEEYISGVPGWELPDYSGETYPWQDTTEDAEPTAEVPTVSAQPRRARKKAAAAAPQPDGVAESTDPRTGQPKKIPAYKVEPSTVEIDRLLAAGVTEVIIGGKRYGLAPKAGVR